MQHRCGDKPGAEAPAFYAGVRALFASHWLVDSDAAVRLTTSKGLSILSPQPAAGRPKFPSAPAFCLVTECVWRSFPSHTGDIHCRRAGGATSRPPIDPQPTLRTSERCGAAFPCNEDRELKKREYRDTAIAYLEHSIARM